MPQSSVVFISQGNVSNAKRFYAFATKWGSRAKERRFNNAVHGAFTMCLLRALQGAGADMKKDDINTGVINAASLKTFLRENTKKFLDENALSAGDENVPDIEIVSNTDDGSDIVIKEVPLQRFPAIITIVSGISGTIDVITGNSIKVDSLQLSVVTTTINLSLPRGVFALQTISANTIVRTGAFKIDGIEEQGNEAKFTLQFS